MNWTQPDVERVDTDLLIVGGGAAGCAAAVEAREAAPHLSVTVVEKAHVHRSGCLAMGLNAINAYLGEGVCVEDYVASTKRDAHGVLREDLVATIAEGVNAATARVETWGLPVPRDKEGRPYSKGPRSIRILGENLKPILARRMTASGARVINRHALLDLVEEGGRVTGGLFFGVRTGRLLIVRAAATILATGGAGGLYRTQNRGDARNRMWYSPFNVGSGYAAALRAGAELTTLEMRFIPTRLRHTAAPTGTLAQTFGAVEENLLGERFNRGYAQAWGKEALTTPERLRALLEEGKAGRGPVFLRLRVEHGDAGDVLGAYLDMTPSQVALWATTGFAEAAGDRFEIGTSGPYVLGGHTGSGLWVDTARRATLPGLYAAGDVAGGAPKKYVSGAWVEGFLAARTALADLRDGRVGRPVGASPFDVDVEGRLAALRRPGPLGVGEASDRLQRILDEYAGGVSTHYELHGRRLAIARRELQDLDGDLADLGCADPHGYLLASELIDKTLTARALVEHLDARRETRWPGYQTRVDYPEPDPAYEGFINSRLGGGRIATRFVPLGAGPSQGPDEGGGRSEWQR